MTEETYENAALVLTRTKYYSGVFEREITEANGVTTEREINFIFAPDGLAAIYEKKNGNMYYVSTDNLGSINIIANAQGNIVNDLSYDAWGRRRDPYTWETLTVAQTKALQPTLITDRGYTLHEHMDAFGLINMNGRAYDPLVGQFLSPDPFVQSPTSPQSYNRYSYCWNNPLKFVDPSGYANDLTWMDIQMRNYCWGTSYTNTDYGWVNTYWYNDFMDYVNSESDGFSTRNGKSGFWIDDSEWNYQLYKKTTTNEQRWDNIAWGNKFSTFDLTSTFVSFEDAISKYTLELEWELIRGFNLDRDYYNYSSPGTMAEADGRGTLYWTGIGLGVAGTYPYLKERSYVKDGMWRSSKNGKWYDIEKRPNGTTGPRGPVEEKAGYFKGIGRKLFYANALISTIQGVDALQNGDTDAAWKSGLDITMGAVSVFGGPIGFGIGTAYMLMDVFFFTSNNISSMKTDPLMFPNDNTYVAPY